MYFPVFEFVHVSLGWDIVAIKISLCLGMWLYNSKCQQCYRIRWKFGFLVMTLKCILCWPPDPELWGMWNTLSLWLLPGPLWLRLVVPVWISSMGQIKLFNHLLRILLFIFETIQLCTNNLYYIVLYTHMHRGCRRGVMVKAMDCGIVVREFEFQSRYYVHFRANTLGKGMNPLILQAMG